MLVGDGDQITPEARAREMAEAIPGAQLIVVPASGHLSTLEQPQMAAAALEAWAAA